MEQLPGEGFDPDGAREHQPGLSFEATGFNGASYLLRIESRLFSIENEDTLRLGEMQISPDQEKVLDFLTQHHGEPYRMPELVEATGLAKGEADAAIYSRTDGLWAFISKAVGEAMLWQKLQRKMQQFGDTPVSFEETEQASVDPLPGEVEAMEAVRLELTTHLNDYQAGVIEMVRLLMPPECEIDEDELVSQVAHGLQWEDEETGDHLQAALHRIMNDPNSRDAFDRKVRGKGYKARTLISMNLLLRTAPPEEDSSQPRQRAAESSLDETIRIIREVNGFQNLEASFRDREPVEWHCGTDGTLTVNGEEIDLYPEEAQLLRTIKLIGSQHLIHASDISLVMHANRINDHAFKNFVIWLNQTIDHLNGMAPIAIVHNVFRDDRRDRKTYYKFNKKGTWDALLAYPQGSAKGLRRRSRANLHSYFQAINSFIDPHSSQEDT